MKVGIALEDLLIDMQRQFAIWKQYSTGDPSSYLEPKCINDESFWATLKLQYDIESLQSIDNLYVLTERPVRLFLVTRSWLRREGIHVRDENIIMRSTGGLKRYDCRLRGLDYFIDSNENVLESFRYDRCIPIGIGDSFPDWMRSYKTINDVRFESDLRDWKLWDDETVS